MRDQRVRTSVWHTVLHHLPSILTHLCGWWRGCWCWSDAL